MTVVGTRKFTHYGRQVAEETGPFLSRSGITVVSGLARGVDSIAHQAALDDGGRTIAVLGSGVDVLNPPENRKMAEAMTQQGAVISDNSPGTPPDGIYFPPRNRIISGLSLAVMVVEAAVFDPLCQEPLQFDQIGIDAGLPIEETSATLALMELKGMFR